MNYRHSACRIDRTDEGIRMRVMIVCCMQRPRCILCGVESMNMMVERKMKIVRGAWDVGNYTLEQREEGLS